MRCGHLTYDTWIWLKKGDSSHQLINLKGLNGFENLSGLNDLNRHDNITGLNDLNSLFGLKKSKAACTLITG